MSDLSRRALLGGAAVLATAVTLPKIPAAAAIAPKVAKPPMLTWIVGTPGENDHEIIRALTREAAVRFRAEECEDDDNPDQPDCDCCACSANGGFEATRVEAWDGRRRDSITDGDWVAAGFDAPCVRCGDPACKSDGGHSVNGRAICCGCMTLADWEIVDPERAAELREEMADV